MSRGPGRIEESLTELFTRSLGTNALFSVTDLCQHVFSKIAQPTRSQRISTLRAAHRIFTRRQLSQNIVWLNWSMTLRANRTVVFHDRSYPVRVWAVDIERAGVLWAEADICSVTERRVNVRYHGQPASLSREMLASRYALWRGLYFTSARNGFAAQLFEEIWAELYGHLFPTLLPFDEAKRLLDVPDGYTREEVLSAFRRAAKRCHPDHGGTAEKFRKLVEARDRLLAAIGAPKEPSFAPADVKLRYVSISSKTPQLARAATRQSLH